MKVVPITDKNGVQTVYREGRKYTQNSNWVRKYTPFLSQCCRAVSAADGTPEEVDEEVEFKAPPEEEKEAKKKTDEWRKDELHILFCLSCPGAAVIFFQVLNLHRKKKRRGEAIEIHGFMCQLNCRLSSMKSFMNV